MSSAWIRHWCKALAVFVLGASAWAPVARGEMIPSGGDGLASLSGYVYADINGSGVRDDFEAAIASVKIVLQGIDDNGDAVDLTTLTTYDGTYSFTDLLPGTYCVTQMQPEMFINGKPNQAGSAGGVVKLEGNQYDQIALPADFQADGYNFGEWGLKPDFISKRFFLVIPEPSTWVTLTIGMLALSGLTMPRRGRGV